MMLLLARLAALFVLAVALQSATEAKRCDVDSGHGSDHLQAPINGKQASPTGPAPSITTVPSNQATVSPVVTQAASFKIGSPPPGSSTATAGAIATTTSLNPFTAPLATVTYNGVGGTGLYGKVTAMQCPSSDSCTQTDYAVTGPLAPFNEDLTLALRGPLNVDDIVVFTQPDHTSGGNSSSLPWTRVSSFDKQAGTTQNMVFLNNKGDPLKSGVFDMCDGNSQSYATSDGKTAATTASQFSGVLDDGVEINVMSATSCSTTSGSCGVSRGVAQEGWKGNNKIFMVKATMPSAPSGGQDVPAIWLLNGQIVRTAQYGCNCRGMGDLGKWKGGCGELDVAEVLPADVNALTSTIYSFKGSRGTNMYAMRPFSDAVVFVVILSQQTTTGSTNLGMAQILMMNPEDVDMTTPPSSEQVQTWLEYRNGAQVNFDI